MVLEDTEVGIIRSMFRKDGPDTRTSIDTPVPTKAALKAYSAVDDLQLPPPTALEGEQDG